MVLAGKVWAVNQRQGTIFPLCFRFIFDQTAPSGHRLQLITAIFFFCRQETDPSRSILLQHFRSKRLQTIGKTLGMTHRLIQCFLHHETQGAPGRSETRSPRTYARCLSFDLSWAPNRSTTLASSAIFLKDKRVHPWSWHFVSIATTAVSWLTF